MAVCITYLRSVFCKQVSKQMKAEVNLNKWNSNLQRDIMQRRGLVYSTCQRVNFCDRKHPAAAQTPKRERNSRESQRTRSRRERTAAAFFKTLVKVRVCHPEDIFQKETTVFRPDLQTRNIFFFYDSHFNPAVTVSEGLAVRPEAQASQILILWCKRADEGPTRLKPLLLQLLTP